MRIRKCIVMVTNLTINTWEKMVSFDFDNADVAK